MNISTPVHNEIKSDFMIEDRELVNRSLVVIQRLDEYLSDLTLLVKDIISNSKDDNKYQNKLHGLAWVATYVESLKQMYIWAKQLFERKNFSNN